VLEVLSGDTALLGWVVAVALIFGLLNGFHDGCNAVSTVIYTKALKPRVAIGLSAFFNLIAPLIVGVAVAETIGGVVKASDASAQLVIAALLGACVWEVLTWLWALPVSSSHALMGGLLGAGLAALGPGGIDWYKVILVFAALFISPFLGILTGYLVMRLSRYFFTRRRMSMLKADRFYRHMQILSSSWVSFSHGSNDATKVMGIIVIFLAAQQGLDVQDYLDQGGFALGLPLWVILSSAAAMAVGTYLSVRSFRLIKTVGEKICELHPINGFSAETGGAIIIQIASLFGLPVSTTHIVTSAVTGTGLASHLGGVSWKVFRAIILAWVVTLPFCAAVAVVLYYLLGLVM
jgi:PiT family inorganic phosphate transporter